MDESTREPRTLPMARFKQAEHERNIYHVDVEEKITQEDLLYPGFWAHVARQLRPRDRIEAHAEDGAWFAELLVIESGANFAKVAILRHVRLDATVPSESAGSVAGHYVKWRGHVKKWSVLRQADEAVLKEGLTTRGEAIAWLEDYGKRTNLAA